MSSKGKGGGKGNAGGGGGKGKAGGGEKEEKKGILQVKVRHILCDKQSKVLEALKLIREDGKSFSEVAQNYSSDKARAGGSLGWITRNDMVGAFSEVAFSQPVGVVSEPFKTQFGEQMTSRFYKASSSSDESDSDQSSSESDSPVQITKKPARYVVSSSEEEVEEKRVVRSAKDKTWILFDENLTAVRNHLKTNDWVSLATDFDNLTKLVQKNSKTITKEGVPPSMIKSLFLIEQAHTSMTAQKKKDLSSTNAKSYNRIKQSLKKTVAQYESQIKVYRDQPSLADKAPEDDDEESESEEDESESESEEDVKPAPKKPAAPSKPVAKSSFFKKSKDSESDEDSEEDSEDDDSDWSSDSESESESDSSSDGGDTSRKWFTKATSKVDKPAPAIGKKPAVGPKKTTPTTTTATTGTAVGAGTTKSPVSSPVTTAGDQAELTQEQILKQLDSVIASRGKKGTNPARQIEQLEKIYTLIQGEKEAFNVLYNLISAQFDTASIQLPLSITVWRSVLENISKLLSILQKNPHFILALEHQDPKLEKGQVVVRGNLLSLFETLDDEFSKSLQTIQYPSQDYINRLADEPSLMDLGNRIQEYYEKIGNNGACAKIAIRLIEHIYFRSSPENQSLLSKLSLVIYQHGDERLNARTILCNIYFNAINNKFHEARDMMLMSHLQDNPTGMDISTQILFNRSMVQLGLCAFRCGYIQETQSCLGDFSGLRRDLLAQGSSVLPRSMEKDPMKEVEEKNRILPAHMHISIDLIETVNLISGMLIAVPQNASRPFDSKTKTCKFYQRHMDTIDRMIFSAPPENFKDIIYHASKSLSTGDWNGCVDLIANLKVWTLLPNPETVREKLNKIIQEVSLKTFLFTYSVYYDTMSLTELSDRFQLPKNHVHSIISKMMTNHEISASWDHSTETITFHRAEQTKLQYLALNYSESLVDFVEQNERIYDIKFGSYRKKSDDNPLPTGNVSSRHKQHQSGRQNKPRHTVVTAN
eukprot:gene5374-6706_t